MKLCTLEIRSKFDIKFRKINVYPEKDSDLYINSTDNFYDPYGTSMFTVFCLFLAHKGKANTEGHKIYFRLICLLLPYLLLKVKSLELIYWLKRCFLIFVFNFCRKNPWNFEFEEMEMNNLGFYTTKIWPNAKEHHVCQ